MTVSNSPGLKFIVAFTKCTIETIYYSSEVVSGNVASVRTTAARSEES